MLDISVCCVLMGRGQCVVFWIEICVLLVEISTTCWSRVKKYPTLCGCVCVIRCNGNEWNKQT
jgi:hypothetical protein